MSLITLLTSCGKKESAVAVQEIQGSDPITSTDVNTFVGVYDLIRMDTENCGASIQIIKLCEGLQLRSNNLGPEQFCNINKGEIRTGDNRSSTIVTLEANVLKSVVSIFDERSTPPGSVKLMFTNTLTLDGAGNLLKVSDLKSRKSRCLYQKR